jgi:hypothetical protein
MTPASHQDDGEVTFGRVWKVEGRRGASLRIAESYSTLKPPIYIVSTSGGITFAITGPRSAGAL